MRLADRRSSSFRDGRPAIRGSLPALSVSAGWLKALWLSGGLLLAAAATGQTQQASIMRPGVPSAANPTAAQPQREERDALRDHLKMAVAAADSFADRFDAEVWLLDMSTRLQRFMPDHGDRLELLRTVHREARAAGLKPDLVLALIEVESRFDRFAISSAGAQGLMQVMPFWKNEIGRPEDNLTDMATNLRYGCQILKFYMDREKGNWMPALARYNGSYGKYWYPQRVMDAWRARWYAGEL